MASPLLDEVSGEGMMYQSVATVADCKGRGVITLACLLRFGVPLHGATNNPFSIKGI